MKGPFNANYKRWLRTNVYHDRALIVMAKYCKCMYINVVCTHGRNCICMNIGCIDNLGFLLITVLTTLLLLVCSMPAQDLLTSEMSSVSSFVS